MRKSYRTNRAVVRCAAPSVLRRNGSQYCFPSSLSISRVQYFSIIYHLYTNILVHLPTRTISSFFAGSLGTSVFDADVCLVGASGGVYALLAAHLANVLLVSTVETPFINYFLFLIRVLPTNYDEIYLSAEWRVRKKNCPLLVPVV